jgi:hypothetical protein
MSRFPRAYRRQLEAADEANIKRAVVPEVVAGASKLDHRRLRGIPAIGRGVSGAIRDTRPGDSLR